MKAKKRRKLAIVLIANDLINSRLIYGLEAMNVIAGSYSLYLTEPIFKLIGIKGEQITEEVFNIYAEMIQLHSTGQSGEPEYKSMLELAVGIYNEILDKATSLLTGTIDELDNAEPDNTEPS